MDTFLGLCSQVMSQCLTGSRLDASTAGVPATQELGFVAPLTSQQYVIVPEMAFQCYGYITSWSALTLINNKESFLLNLNYQITFTLWRPRGDGSYDLAGVNDLTFGMKDFMNAITSIDNSTGRAPENSSYFHFQNKQPIINSNISFQPGDVIGYNVEKAIGIGVTITVPVLLAYRKRTTPEQGSVDLMYIRGGNETRHTFCSFEHCDRVTTDSSVVPYLTVHYGKRGDGRY